MMILAEMNLEKLLNYKLLQLGSYKLYVSTLLGVLVIWLVTHVLLYLIRFGLLRLIRRGRIDGNRTHSIFLIIKYFVWTGAVVAMLDFVGIKISFLLASSAALLVGIGLGLQQIFSDIVSGLFLLFEGSIKVNDVLEMNGIVGRIEEINLRNSIIRTRDGIAMIVPNSKFVAENVVNWSHMSQAVRFKVTVGVSYQADVELVRKVLIEAASEHPDVLADEQYPVIARITEFADSSINFEVLFWSHRIFDIEHTRSDIRFAIRRKFNERGISIPFPQRDIHIVTHAK